MRYFVKKFFSMAATLFLVSFLVFAAFEVIPGDVAVSMLGTNATESTVAALREELGLKIHQEELRKLAVYGEPGRIAAYQDGSIWRMVIVVFGLELSQPAELAISKESKELKFFTKEEIRDIEIVVTHSDIVEDWFLKK